MSFGRVEPEKEVLLPKPTSVEAAIKDIRQVFKEQPVGGWGEREQRVFLEGLKLEPKKLELYSPDEIKLILRRLMAARMVLYRKGK
jgi:hypothetical protein